MKRAPTNVLAIITLGSKFLTPIRQKRVKLSALIVLDDDLSRYRRENPQKKEKVGLRQRLALALGLTIWHKGVF